MAIVSIGFGPLTVSIWETPIGQILGFKRAK